MKIIINTTNLKKGGAIQASSALFEDLSYIKGHDLHVLLSPAFDNLSQLPDSENIKYYQCDYPTKLSLGIFNKELQNLEQKISPDCVFSVFGPTYWNPKAPHVMGFANGLYLFDDLPFYSRVGLFTKIKEFIRKTYHRFLLRSNATHFIVETDLVRSRFSKFLGIDFLIT